MEQAEGNTMNPRRQWGPGQLKSPAEPLRHFVFDEDGAARNVPVIATYNGTVVYSKRTTLQKQKTEGKIVNRAHVHGLEKKMFPCVRRPHAKFSCITAEVALQRFNIDFPNDTHVLLLETTSRDDTDLNNTNMSSSQPAGSHSHNTISITGESEVISISDSDDDDDDVAMATPHVGAPSGITVGAQQESLAPTEVQEVVDAAVPDDAYKTEEMTVPTGVGEVTPNTVQDEVKVVEEMYMPTETEEIVAATVQGIINKVTTTPTPEAAYPAATTPTHHAGEPEMLDDAAPATPDVVMRCKKRCHCDVDSQELTDAAPSTKKPRRWLTPARAALAFGCVTAVGVAPYVVNNPAMGELATAWKDQIVDNLNSFALKEMAAAYRDQVADKLIALSELAATSKDTIVDKLPAFGEMAVALKEQILNKLCSL